MKVAFKKSCKSQEKLVIGLKLSPLLPGLQKQATNSFVVSCILFLIFSFKSRVKHT